VSSSSELPAEAPFTPGRFAGRTAIVTGAGSGIGRATALRLAREGARVVAADIAADRLEQLAAEFADLDLVPVAGDIATEEGVQAVVAAAGGRVDALANVAGIMDAFLPPAEVDDATWERVFAVNVTAVMRLTRAVLPIMQTTIPPVATAEQLAATITWLLSDDASNVNGAILPSDGGWSAI
jgi:NAD(P)-dependent dehydrogenase (short-subunit alcohol dehydrogenase family)